MNKLSITIALGCDHAGFKLKESLKKYLLENAENKYEVKDFGAYSEEKADYTYFAHQVATAVERNEFNFGLLMCGSGNGINMTANKHKGIRAALSWNAEIAKLSRLHNNANILTLPARFIDLNEAKACLDIFFTTAFEGGRHAERVNKISEGC